MAEIHPFRGFRYQLADAADLAQVVAPPYDIVSPAQQAALYARSPYNSIRLELGRDADGDDQLENRYTRAADLFARWRRDGVLRQEDHEVFYAYVQDFTVNGKSYSRTSLLARVRLQPWEAGVVVPHEHTLAKPKSDRLALLRACAANLSPIMATFDDAPDGEPSVGAILAAEMLAAPPLIDITDDNGERHRLWSIAAGASIAALRQVLAPRQLFIADGHHRYETALEYRESVRALHRTLDERDAANFVMMALIPTSDPGLVILPTHRLVGGVASQTLDALPDRLAEFCEMIPLEGRLSAKTLGERLTAARATGPALVVVTAKQRWLVRPNDAARHRMAATAMPEPWQLLDVALAQELILGAGLAIAPNEISTGDQVSYTRDIAEALAEVKQQRAQVAILLNATRPEQVRDVALAGGRMPQKSTYFYPKLITGLVINPLW